MTLPLLAVPLLAGALVSGSLPATAADSTPGVNAHSTLAAIQAAGANATSRRVTSLNTAIGKVTANKVISDADRSTVLGTLNADLGAMNSLKSKIAADTTASTAWTDYQSIFTGYRVYAVAIPQALVAAGADGLTGTAIPKLQSAASDLAPRVAGNASLQSDLDDMNAKIQTAQTDANGLSAAALAVTPADFNANSAVMSDLRAKLRDALAAAKSAAQDGRTIVQGLQ